MSGIAGATGAAQLPASAADLLSQLAAAASQPAAEARLAASVAREARLAAAGAGSQSPAQAAADRADRIEGLRNRIFLKYLGVDFEMFNQADGVYRGTGAGTGPASGTLG